MVSRVFYILRSNRVTRYSVASLLIRSILVKATIDNITKPIIEYLNAHHRGTLCSSMYE